MRSRTCVVHAARDLRIDTADVGEPGPGQVLVRIGAGGICGSDLHYFQDGGFGAIRVREPLTLGHEVAGTVERIGAGVTRVREGQRIALNPSRACGRCSFCQSGQHQHCVDMVFYGSARTMPHSQGAFRDWIVAEETQCEPVGEDISVTEAACCEPLSVALHAVRQAGGLVGKRVLVTGAGPIGALAVAAARFAGALEIVACDLRDRPLAIARQMGATDVVNTATQPDAIERRFCGGKGYFDVVLECTGAPAILSGVLPAVAPRGVIVQVGYPDSVTLALGTLISKEISLVGTHRFNGEFSLAARLVSERRIDVRPVISAVVPLNEAAHAFELAGDRNTHMKVLLDFS
ncbi:L-idonate 5-dehydrogenase [Uliginosibacterium sp. sgz301328]|uniref:L-idonate 5-dehydrogenase n=1 Tax=Uliginosibacterium sp. sgz301328 TaxID=3243764 RepID=UPI00359E7760